MLTGDQGDGALRGEAEDTAAEDTADRHFRREAKGSAVLRELRLRRRRSRIPWIYLLYQARKSALPSQKRRDVERLEVEIGRLFV